MSRTANGGRHAQPRRRASGAATLLPARTSSRSTQSSRGGRRRAEGAPRIVRSGGSHRSSRPATADQVAVGVDGKPVPWARTVAFSGVTGVAALTVGFTVLTDTDTASGFSPGASPQQTVAVTVIERAEDHALRPVARRTAPAEYAAPEPGAGGAEPATHDGASAPTPVLATPTARPSAAPEAGPSSDPGSAPESPAAPKAPGDPAPPPAPEESPSPGLLDGLADTLGDTVTGVVGVLPDLDG